MLSRNRHVQFPIDLERLAIVTVSFPLTAFFFCIFWSYLYNYENSTYTHCEVANFAPSISAAIGTFVPQKFVWQTCIALHSAPRFLYVVLYNILYNQRLILTPRTQVLIKFNFLTAVLENLALLGLSVVSSQEQFEVHKACFGTFLLCAFLYMSSSFILFTRCGFQPQNRHEITSIFLKKSILGIYFVFVPLLMFFYYRHNQFCEPYVYSMFCLCEYTIVVANMMFHCLATYDMYGLSVTLPSSVPEPTGYASLKEEA